MKSSLDPRHLKRRRLVKQLFAYSFHTQAATNLSLKEIITDLPNIDELISQAAPQFPLKKINKVDLAILRLAIYELKLKKEPVKVIIDEAVELGKEFGSENSPKFINGVLGNILKNLN